MQLCKYLFGALKPKPFGLLISGVPCRTYSVPGSYIKVLYSHLLFWLPKLFWRRVFVAVLQKLVVSISLVQCWYLCVRQNPNPSAFVFCFKSSLLVSPLVQCLNLFGPLKPIPFGNWLLWLWLLLGQTQKPTPVLHLL